MYQELEIIFSAISPMAAGDLSHLVAERETVFAQSAKLEAAIRAGLNQLNYQP